ncbi:hypothetical protein A2U01_0081419, partial [Trifolium medium]|nr:hypothetical protein [Trifolium medium]
MALRASGSPPQYLTTSLE